MSTERIKAPLPAGVEDTPEVRERMARDLGSPAFYDGLPPLDAKGRFIGYAADGSAWVLGLLQVLGNKPEWGATGFEDAGWGSGRRPSARPCAKLLVDDLADFIVVSVPAIMPKRPREASHGEATDQAPADTAGPEQRGAPVSGRGDSPGEASDQAQDDEGAGGAGAGGRGAGEGEKADEAQALSRSQRRLLEWLGKEDVSQYGECRGEDFDALEALGLVVLNGTKDNPRVDYLGCRLTETGLVRLAMLKNE